MLKKAVPNLKRWVSGYLVAVITLMLVFNNSFALSALAAETASESNAQATASDAQSTASASEAIRNGKVTLKNSPKEDVQIFVFSEDNDYQPGDTVCLDLYIKNNTDQPITDGMLKFKAKGIEEDSAYFEDLNDIYQAKLEEQEKAEAEETKDESEEESGAQGEEESTQAEETETGNPAEETLAPAEETESETEVLEETIAGSIEESAEPETTEAAEEEEKDEEEEDSEPTRLEELEILPGEAYYVNFYYTIDPEIENLKAQKVDFSFTWTDENTNGKRNTKETFRYAIDGMNLLPVVVGSEKGWVETGKDDEIFLEFDLGSMAGVLEEKELEELEKNPDAQGTSSNASHALVGWEAENEGRLLGKKDPAVIKDLKCQVETFGLKLDKFKVVPMEEDDNYGTSVTCGFYVSRKNAPGLYYGKINASYKIKGKSYHTSQSFTVLVKQETGELELSGKVGDAEIIMTGPVESFPKADELSLKVTEITEEQQEKVDEALQKKAEEEGTEVNKYKALDIKLIADGEETEPSGNVQVRFKNVNLESADEKKEAEPEKQSIAGKAISKVMSLFGVRDEEEDISTVAEENEKAAGTDEDNKEAEEKTTDNSENIQVLHLDEEAVVANEMKSKVQENGDIIMDTDHFSIYVLVDMGRPGGKIDITVEHWAAVKTIMAKDNDGNELPGIIDNATDSTETLDDSAKYREENNIDENKKYAVKDSNGSYKFGPYLKDQVYNRYTQEINTKLCPVSEIYVPSEDKIEIQNEKRIDKIESLSKLSVKIDGSIKSAKEKGYRIKEIWITNDENNLRKEEWNGVYTKYTVKAYDEDNNVDVIATEDGTEKASITLTQNSIIRFVYEEVKSESATAYFPVTFYDHNIYDDTNHYEATHAPESHSNRAEKGLGLNQDMFFKSGAQVPRIESGQRTSGNNSSYQTSTWNSFKLNEGNKKDGYKLAYAVKGLVKENLDSNGNLQFADGINYTKFFEEATYGDKNDPMYASKEYKGYALGFKKEGDTYFLTTVKKPNGSIALENLDDIRFTQSSYSKDSALFSNSFWPLDDVEYYKGKDHLEKGTEGIGASDATGAITGDGKIHNWHFGMVYEFDFTVDDYQGPMNFYFRGDDDFWMFIDGKLAIDIGGIHSAAGEALDVKEFLKRENGGKVEGTHHVKIYFMERGGFGSCCYMQYTLPNCEAVSFPGVDTTNIKVEKKWEEPGDSLRTDKITVQLYRKKVDNAGQVVKESGKTYDEQGFTLIDDENIEPEKDLAGIGNVWQCSWRNLPKIDPNPPHYRYIYKVKEKEVQGYIASYVYTSNGTVISEDAVGSTDDVNCTITNILSPKLSVEVEKIWKDQYPQDNVNYPEVMLQLQYKKEGDTEFIDFPGDKGVLILDGTPELGTDDKGKEKNVWEDKSWHGCFRNLPSYADKTDENGNIQYENKTDENGDILYEYETDENGNVITDENGNPIKDLQKPIKGNPIRVPIVAYRVREYRLGSDGKYILLEDDNSKFSEDYVVTYEDIRYAPSEEDSKKLVATTKITNTATIDKCVIKNWEGVPSGEQPIARVGLYKQNTETSDWVLVRHLSKKASTGDSITWLDKDEEGAKTQDFILELKYDPSSTSRLGEWKNLPKCEENGTLIVYGIFEINDSDDRIVIPESGRVIESVDGHKYEVLEGLTDVNDETPHESENEDSGSEVESGSEISDDETGTQGGKTDVVFITNRYMVDLEITKVIPPNYSIPQKEFEFTATIEKGGQKITLPSPAPNEKVGYQVVDGTVKFTLKVNQKVTIPVPMGSQVTIKEDKASHVGYHVSYKVGDAEPTNGDTFTVDIPADGKTPTVEVTCTNTPGAILPDTGGPGLLMMSRFGWMLLLLAILMAGMEIQFYGERRNRKTATAQRENSRGFSSGDY